MIPLDIAGVRSICQISSDRWSILLSLNEGKVCNFSQTKWDKNTSNLSPPCLFFFFKLSNLTLTSHFQKHSSCLWVGHTAQHPTDIHEPVLSEAALLSHSDSDVDGNSVCYEDTHTFLLSLLVTSLSALTTPSFQTAAREDLLQHLPTAPYTNIQLLLY